MKILTMIMLISLPIAIGTGCITQKRCAEKFPPSVNVSDSSMTSIHEVTIIKDSVSYLPPDSSWLKALLQCNEKGEIIMKQLLDYEQGKNARLPVVDIKKNVLTAKCRIDSLAVFNHYSKHVGKQVEYRDRVITNVKETNRVTGWQKIQIRAFWVLATLCLLTGIIIIKFR